MNEYDIETKEARIPSRIRFVQWYAWPEGDFIVKNAIRTQT